MAKRITIRRTSVHVAYADPLTLELCGHASSDSSRLVRDATTQHKVRRYSLSVPNLI